jgi:hypothetical protein
LLFEDFIATDGFHPLGLFLVANIINTMTYNMLDNIQFLMYNAGVYSGEYMPRTSPFLIVLSDAERSVLERIANKYTSPYCTVVRAKAVLMAAQGLDNKTIGQSLSLPRQIVSKWRKRFFDERLEGLDDRSRAGRPSDFPPSGGHAS